MPPKKQKLRIARKGFKPPPKERRVQGVTGRRCSHSVAHLKGELLEELRTGNQKHTERMWHPKFIPEVAKFVGFDKYQFERVGSVEYPGTVDHYVIHPDGRKFYLMKLDPVYVPSYKVNTGDEQVKEVTWEDRNLFAVFENNLIDQNAQRADVKSKDRQYMCPYCDTLTARGRPDACKTHINTCLFKGVFETKWANTFKEKAKDKFPVWVEFAEKDRTITHSVAEVKKGDDGQQGPLINEDEEAGEEEEEEPSEDGAD